MCDQCISSKRELCREFSESIFHNGYLRSKILVFTEDVTFCIQGVSQGNCVVTRRY